MAISRFDKFTPRDYNMEWYVPQEFMPNFEAWDKMLASKQTKYDTAIALSQKLPKHLANRVDLAGEYKAKTDQAINDISQAYTKDITAGDRMIRDYGINLNRDWQAGGLAYELEQEVADYAKAQEEITKYYKDAKAENSANKNLAMYKLQEAAKKDFKFDPNTGLYTRATISAETTPYVDIMEEAQKVVKEIKDSGSTQIAQISPQWFKKIKTEGVTEETIRGVANELLQQPKYADQLAVELWNTKRQYTPDQLTAIEDQAKKDFLTGLDQSSKLLNEKIKTEKGARQIQTELANAGYYDGDIDGKFGKKSKDAYNKYIADQKQQVDKITADGVLTQQLKSNYVDPLAKTYARMKVDQDLIYNKPWEVAVKLQATQAENAKLIAGWQNLMEPNKDPYLVSPGSARPLESFDIMGQNARKAYETSSKAFNDVVSSSGIHDILGTKDNSMVHYATEARRQSKTPEEFDKNLKAYGIFADPNQLWNFYNSPAAIALNDSYENMARAKSQVSNVTATRGTLYNEFFKSPEGKKELNEIRRKSGVGNNVTDEQLINMINADDPKFTSTSGARKNYGDFRKYSTTVDFDVNMNKPSLQQDLNSKIESWMKKNPDAFPSAMRGFTVNANSGHGKVLHDLLVNDFTRGNLKGYLTDKQPSIVFKDASGDEVNTEIKPESIELNVTSDIGGITYVIRGKDTEGNDISTTLNAPDSHKDNLKNMALDMYQKGQANNNNAVMNMAMQIYTISTGGSKAGEYALEDKLDITKKDNKMDLVIDPNSSNNNKVSTFGDNIYITGSTVGNPIVMGNQVFQKYKVADNRTGIQSFMLTTQVKDKNGNILYLPIANKDEGLYYNSSSDAERFLVETAMRNELPSLIQTSKMDVPNVNLQQAATILQQGIQQNNSLLNEDD